MRNRHLWFLFFIICLGVGFLHGILPLSVSKKNIIASNKIEILATDEILLPEALRRQIEKDFNVKISYTVTRNWDNLIAQLVASPSVDLIFLPSYWAKTLSQQGLLADISEYRKALQKKVASDFIGDQSQFYFLPFFWIKTEIRTPHNESFISFLKNKSEPDLFIIADEDLLLKYFQNWKEQNIWDLASQKKVFTLQLDQLAQPRTDAAFETPFKKESRGTEEPSPGALLTWGAAIPSGSANKKLVADILDALTSTETQESLLLKTPFNTTFSALTSDKIPGNRRALFVRDIELKNALIIQNKDQNAKTKLKDQFNFTL
ncbi:MAG: hypothetical protein ACXVCY_08165 [Pseudobdellovibrionaceae bacterium]